MEKKAVYPGSFDPITNGHVDIINRGLKVFDKIIVAVLDNPSKAPYFSTKERVSMIRELFVDQKRIVVRSFHGLLVDFVKANGANVVIRGLRAISDFEFEFQMALMNQNLNPEVETFFMMPNVKFSYLSSNMVKEVASLGGRITSLVPGLVGRKLRNKIEGTRKVQS